MVTAIDGRDVKGHGEILQGFTGALGSGDLPLNVPPLQYAIGKVLTERFSQAVITVTAGFLAMNAIRPDWGKVNNC